MKKFLNISLLSLVALATLSLSSCKNEIDEIFDEDAVARLDKAKAEYIDILTSNGGKWQMQYYANGNEPGYVYLMTFRNDGSVTIAGKNEWIGYVEGESLKVPPTVARPHFGKLLPTTVPCSRSTVSTSTSTCLLTPRISPA